MGIELFLGYVTLWIYTFWKISACPGTTLCNKFEQSNTRGDILNGGDNVDDQETFGFT